jgi:hypothetical protein
MNRFAISAGGVAAAILIGFLALRRSAEDAKDANSRPAADTPGVSPAEYAPAAIPPAMVVSENEMTSVTEAVETRSWASDEKDYESVNFEDLAATVSVAQIPAALGGLSDDEHDQNLRAELLRRWTSAHPADAAQWATALPEGELRRNALTTVAAQWASQDISTARQWAQNLEATGRDTVMRTLATEAASQNPLGALDLALQIQETTARANAVAFAVAQWAADDPSAALDWTLHVADEKMRQRLDRWVTPVIAESDPVAAVDYIMNRSRQAPDNTQVQTAVEVVQRWTQQAPEAAAGWVETFADPALRAFAMDAVMRIWSETDSATAHQWLFRQPTGEFRDEATVAYASAVAPRDRAAASDLARTIQDATRRQQLLAQIASLDIPLASPSTDTSVNTFYRLVQ